eukprot:CAMPEP_0119308758 /NCGR_PEP_ID=MMETSP1333-20130426/12704_1 /TAXON_ID=418940 /ORGANISM="Scyphosphaera apsteinii, Strain RCC1455" /LENGTH=221 /DNA_ID=CAMNT_0007312599 /DNA_START=77 /DNA_END=742 /DNA_ORIENTATION=+
MNDTEINQQITQMVQFIHQEASEKAQEITLKAKEEFEIEKLRMVELEKQKIRQQYEVKEKQVEVKKRIEQSNTVRLGRLESLKKRDEKMQEVLAAAAAKLPGMTVATSYPALLESLILEALKTLAEAKVSIKGVSGQAAAVQKQIEPAKAKFKEWAAKTKGAAFADSIVVTFDPTPLQHGIGGVEVTGFGGKISLVNTLQSRLMLAYETRLPQLRAALFKD